MTREQLIQATVEKCRVCDGSGHTHRHIAGCMHDSKSAPESQEYVAIPSFTGKWISYNDLA